MLDWRCARAHANLREQCFACGAIGIEHPDLDELVARQRTVDFGQHGIAEAVATDHHDRVQHMGACPQCAAGDCGERRLQAVFRIQRIVFDLHGG